jgi:cytochrome c oxidase cbb3-type subunit III
VTMRRWAASLLPCALCIMFVACEREERPFQGLPTDAAGAQHPVINPLHAGGPPPPLPELSPFQQNAWGISEGKRLYENVNCVGCHSHGGGGMGPALMDDKWIYGSYPGNMFATIVEGRPNGMPAFRNRLTDTQVWQIVAYIQSMSGQAPIAALPGRSDHLSVGAPESQRPAETPRHTGTP